MDPSAPTMPACHWHPDRPAGIVCQRCDRPICPSCMRQASVGFHCPDCARAGAQHVYQGPAALRSRPVLTQVLIVVNLAVFVVGMLLSGANNLAGSAGTLQREFGLTAKLWERGGSLFLGPVNGSEMVGVGAGEWYRIVTSGFLHFGAFHIAFNMYALWILGQALEGFGGRVKFGAVYAVGLLGGSLGALLLSPQGLTAGASGAIYGLMGAVFLAQRAQGIPFRDSPLLIILIINLVLTFGVASISVGGHLGGLVFGGVAGYVVYDLARRPSVGDRTALVGVAGLGVALAVASIAFATTFQPTF
jgi:membrane associated rhomboid family serine protease